MMKEATEPMKQNIETLLTRLWVHEEKEVLEEVTQQILFDAKLGYDVKDYYNELIRYKEVYDG